VPSVVSEGWQIRKLSEPVIRQFVLKLDWAALATSRGTGLFLAIFFSTSLHLLSHYMKIGISNGVAMTVIRLFACGAARVWFGYKIISSIELIVYPMMSLQICSNLMSDTTLNPQCHRPRLRYLQNPGSELQLAFSL
jgi:hypothetical protein